MTRTSDIDFRFEGQLDVCGVVHQLMAHGVSFSRNGQVSYVLDSDGIFDWKSIHDLELRNVVISAAEGGVDTSFGVTLFLDNHVTGGDLLFHPGRRDVSFMVTVNRKLISGSQRFCDFGWYLHRLVPVFEKFSLCEVAAHDYE